MRPRLLIAGIIPLFLFSLGFGQAKEITWEAYLGAYTAALNNVSGLPRRRVEKTEEFSNGRITKTYGEIDEVQDDKTRRYVYTETVGKRETREEHIEIDGVNYCRTGLGRWRKTTDDCSQRGARFVASNTESQAHHTTEQVTLSGTPVTLLRHYHTFKAQDAQHIWENSVWIDRSYRIVRREFKSVILNKNYTSLVETYDYNVQLKILAPLK